MLSQLFLICILSALISSTHQSNDESGSFGSPEIYTNLYLLTAYHLEEDIRDSDQLLMSAYGGLYAVKKGQEAQLLVGSERAGYGEGKGRAYFKRVSGFRQVNATHVLLVDHGNHCLRFVNRTSRATAQLAGKCTSSGSEDGNMQQSRFYKPFNIIDGFYLDEFVVTDMGNNAIRLLQLNYGVVSTIARDNNKLYQPTGLVLDHASENLFVIVKYGVVQVNVNTGMLEPLTSPTKGFKDGLLGLSQFGEALDIIPIANNSYIIPDKSHSRLRVLDIDHHRVETPRCQQGGDEACYVKTPYCVALSNDKTKLFVGQKDSIRLLPAAGIAADNRPDMLNSGATRIHRPSTTVSTTMYAITPSLIVGSQPIDWSRYVIITLVIVIIALINVVLFMSLRMRRLRQKYRRNSMITSPEDNAHPLIEQAGSLQNDVRTGLIDEGASDASVPSRSVSRNPSLRMNVGYEALNSANNSVHMYSTCAVNTNPGSENDFAATSQ